MLFLSKQSNIYDIIGEMFRNIQVRNEPTGRENTQPFRVTVSHAK
jgi:hypothetical protein